MCPIKFSEQHTPGFLPSVRDKFGRDCGSGGTPENRSGFFDFLQQKRWDTVTHNPLVPGSSPGGPTISHRNHSVMASRARDSSPLVHPIGGGVRLVGLRVGEWATDTPLAAGAYPTRPGPGLPLTTPLGCPAPPSASREKCAVDIEAFCSQLHAIVDIGALIGQSTCHQTRNSIHARL